MIKSTNQGDNWVAVDTGITGDLYGIYFINEEIGYIVSSDGQIYRTATSGDTFTLVGTIVRDGIDINLRNVFCLDVNKCWVVGSGEYVYKTTSGGTIGWDEIDTIGAVSSYHSVYFSDEDNGWITGQNQIKKSADGGESWEISRADISYASGNIPSNMIRDIDFAAGVGYAVGDTYEGAGLILRNGEPRRVAIIIEPEPVELDQPVDTPADEDVECVPVTDDCEAGWDPFFTYDANGCAVSYECVRDLCQAAYNDCLSPIVELVLACQDEGGQNCLDPYREEYDTCVETYQECTGTDEDDTIDLSAGFSPSSAFWGVDRFFERVDLFLTTDKAEKAKKRLVIAQERMLEMKVMVEENKLEAAAKAKEAHSKLLEDVSNDLAELKETNALEEIKKVVYLESQLEKYNTKLKKNLADLELKRLDPEQKKVMISLRQDVHKSIQKIKEKKEEVKVKVKKELGESGQEKVKKVEQQLEKAKKAKIVLSNAETSLSKLEQLYEDNEFELQSIKTLKIQATDKLAKARISYNSGNYGQAYGLANAALQLIDNAMKLMERDSELAFVSRLKEDEGINYMFESDETESKAKTIVDSTSTVQKSTLTQDEIVDATDSSQGVDDTATVTKTPTTDEIVDTVKDVADVTDTVNDTVTKVPEATKGKYIK